MRSYLALFAALAGIARAQPAAAPLTFEVATIRPAPPLDPAKMMKGQMRIGAKIDAGRAEYNFTLFMSRSRGDLSPVKPAAHESSGRNTQ